MKKIVPETYEDIENNKDILIWILDKSGHKANSIDLRRIPGVAPDQMRVFSLYRLNDPIDLVLRIAEINMEILMSTLFDEVDLFTSDGAQILLKKKLIRSGIGENYLDGYLSLLELNNIPDTGKAVADDSLYLVDIFKIRQKKVAKEFRKWLKEVKTKDCRELEKLFVESLKNHKTLIDSLPVKVIRFAITSSASALSLEAGFAVSTVDNFFVNKWLSGYSPKLFFDELSKIKVK